MRVAVERLDGVRSATVSLDSGFVDITFADTNAVSVIAVRDVILRQGFTPREADVRVRGVIERGAEVWLVVPGVMRLEVRGPPDGLARLGASSVIEGRIPGPEAAGGAGVLVLRMPGR